MHYIRHMWNATSKSNVEPKSNFLLFSQQFFTLFCLWVIIIPFSKQKKGKLSITIEKEYIPLLNSRLAFTVVVHRMEVLTFSSNWFWGSDFKSPCSKFFVTIFFIFFSIFKIYFLLSFFYLCGAYSYCSNIMW